MKAFRTPWKIALLVALATLLSACQLEWGTWGNGPERHGENQFETKIRPDTVSRLHRAWTANLGATINSQPIVATGIDLHGTPTDLVYVGTEHGVLFAISTAGHVIWQRTLGTSTQPACLYTPDGIYGLSASVAFDRLRNRVYVANGNGYVYALDPATGATAPGWPVQIATDGVHEVVTGSPTLHGSHLYFETASHCDLL
ncbi:MAG: hypothetical protein QOI55_3036, partial [Actinomycetota bacterium]|nr:hypothetical protein [Actinomycetota bacterium]